MEIYERYIKPILDNQVATGLSFTAALGMVAYQFKQVPSHLKFIIDRALIVKLRVNSSDPAYKWIEIWLSKQPYTGRSTSVVLKSTPTDDDSLASSGDKGYLMSPGPGYHWFFWKKRLVWMHREINENAPGVNPYKDQQAPLETIWLHTFGRSQKVLRQLIDEAQAQITVKDLICIQLWRGWWTSVRGKKARPLGTVILKSGQMEDILGDVEHFFASRPYYVERGIPWRRGYLISGPPGTGKTSFVLALAAHLKRTICVLNLGSIDSDDDLFSAMLDAPLDAIILIEDIDCADSSHARKVKEPTDEPAKDEKAEGITKAGLLNALDGVTTPDGRILIMTTNYPEALDPALIRPGRADVHYVFDYLGAVEQEKMSSLYFGEGVFVPLPYNVSPAEMQKAFMLYPNDPIKARETLEQATSHE